MHKFKVGDKVVRKEGMGKDTFFQDRLGGKMYYVVTSVSAGGYWLQLDGWCSNHNTHPWYVLNFELYQEPKDELPPVPDSVMYFNSVRDNGNDQHLVLERTDRSDAWHDEATAHIGLKVAPRTGSKRAAEAIGINLTPEAALQLAHDIRRMAMQVKREHK
jgi:hypothetical protein